MRVVYFIDNLGHGGAQRQAVELARRLHLDHGARVSFGVYHDIDFYGPRLRELGIPVTLLTKRGKWDAAFVGRVRRWLREEAPDLVHAFLLAPALWSLLAKLSLPRGRQPVFLAGERCELIARSRRQSVLQRFVYGWSDGVTANAASAAKQIHARLGIPEARIHYLPNGIDLERWDREAEGECPLPLDRDRFQIALIGGFRPQKNHGLLLEALARLEPARLARLQVWLVGGERDTPDYPAWVKAEIDRRNLAACVRIAPPTPAVPALMRALDLLVLPSLYEGFPNVLLEAMASRLPAIATPVGDVPNMLEDGRTGVVVPLGAPDALAAAIVRLHDASPAARRAVGAQARAVVEARYRMGVVARAHLELYGRLLAAAGALPFEKGDRPAA